MRNIALNVGLTKIFPGGLSIDFDTYDIKALIDNVEIQSINYYKRSRILEIKIESNELVSSKLLAEIEDELIEYFNLNSVEVKIKYKIEKPIEELLDLYWENIVYITGRRIATTRSLLLGCVWTLSGNILSIQLKTKGSEILKAQGCRKFIETYIEEAFSKSLKVVFKDCIIDDNYNKNYIAKKNEEEQKALNNIIIMPPSHTNNEVHMGSKAILGKDFKDPLMKMKGINQDSGKVAIWGDILSLEFKEIRGERYIVIFDITDTTNSLTVKFFCKKPGFEEIEKNLKVGMTVKVRGEVQYDRFAREPVIMASDIIPCGKQERMDTSEEKRVELHLHTQMSAMDGVAPVEELIKRAAKWEHKAIAITDHGVIQAYPQASALTGKCDIKIIYGVECYLIDDTLDDNFDYTKAHSYHAIILVKSNEGLKNLYKIISESHLEYYYKRPRVTKSMLMKYREGLILGTACEAGELYSAILNASDEEEINRIALFYDYFEIQPLGNNQFLIDSGKVNDKEELKKINREIIILGEKLRKPVVATCDVHFLDPEDEVYRRILMAGQGYSDADKQAPLYFRTTDEMLEEFSYLGKEKAYEVVVTNTNKINNMIDNIEPVPKGTFPPKIEGAEDEIKNLSITRAKEVYGEPLPKVVEERLNKELESIINNGFSVMYLIATKLVQKSLEDGYLVGSRGSVGSSFVAYLTGITEVNPLQPHFVCLKCKYSEFITDGRIDCGYDLNEKKCPKCGEILIKDGYDIPFETFLGFNGDKEPDIDLNFSGEYQSTAHKYVEELFGEEHVFRAGTIASVADKTAFGFVKNYLDERGIVTTNAELNRLIRGCTGIKRTTGQHPGGVMIIPQDKDIYDFTPIQHPADNAGSNTITTHFDYNFLHGSILKLDILGHDTPTTIKMLEDLTGVDARTIPIGDPKTMELFSSTNSLGIAPEDINSEVATFAIPEFGTRFVRQMLVETRPKTMSELIKISGLSHGKDVWTNNAQELIKSNKANLSQVICTRDDIMLYLIYAGLPPIISFKIMEEVRRGRGLTREYEEIMEKNNVPSWYIESCKKIKYMFPKAHAAAYVMMAFRIAWFKVNYPVEFYATYFSIKVGEFDAEIMIKGNEEIKEKILELESSGNNLTQKDRNILTLLEVINEMYARGIEFLPVDLYKSDANTFLIEEGRIRPPLSALPGLGVTAAKNIILARNENEFSSIDDLRLRAGISKTVIDILKQHGCLSDLPEDSQISLFCDILG